MLTEQLQLCMWHCPGKYVANLQRFAEYLLTATFVKVLFFWGDVSATYDASVWIQHWCTLHFSISHATFFPPSLVLFSPSTPFYSFYRTVADSSFKGRVMGNFPAWIHSTSEKCCDEGRLHWQNAKKEIRIYAILNVTRRQSLTIMKKWVGQPEENCMHGWGR